jgi:hypothetical protein
MYFALTRRLSRRVSKLTMHNMFAREIRMKMSSSKKSVLKQESVRNVSYTVKQKPKIVYIFVSFVRFLRR